MRSSAVVLIAGCIATLVFTGSAPGQEGAKALFYGSSGASVMPKPAPAPGGQVPPAPPARESYMGLSYWIELIDRTGQSRRVTADRIFRAGERIRLNVQSNRDGYLYLINLGSTGRSSVLFPNVATAAGGNAVRAGASYAVPQSAFLRFDENPGEEVLVVMLSPAPMDSLTPSARTPSVSAEDTARLLSAAQAKGAKDLVVEVDSQGSQPAAYVVAPLSALRDGGMITLHVTLKHQ